jgi:hypothetical protein
VQKCAFWLPVATLQFKGTDVNSTVLMAFERYHMCVSKPVNFLCNLDFCLSWT